ncbi:cbb3-type cytochrome c oxidase subunit I [Sphingobacterium zeae]|uniref:Cytochrome c oxidase cbb3-type subunit 1 n=1 Tax=Sphingobacterium zeae TaxID=1776859 RepID=A0ABU0U4G7_9SPHI|nr:cbb3-type cytochrome c oxidase subunit I [Sphingobacterium zeae]MDQ1149141.1 cytochrome c oxidase cbb3-type subunit 1 [Sphingobacterium zeae]
MKIIQLFITLFLLMTTSVQAQEMLPYEFSFTLKGVLVLIIFVCLITLLLVALSIKSKAVDLLKYFFKIKTPIVDELPKTHIQRLNKEQLQRLFQKRNDKISKGVTVLLIALNLVISNPVIAQTTVRPEGNSLFGETGIIITLLLILLPIIVGILILIIKVRGIISQQKDNLKIKETEKLTEYFNTLSEEELSCLERRKKALEYALSNDELSGTQAPNDIRGLLQYQELESLPVFSLKKKALTRSNIDPALSKIVLWFLGTAVFWLVFGTTVGEYLGIKFIAPDADQISWLSFGRLRPVHTNAVFWGWASLGMIGLGYYIVPRVSNTSLANVKWAWYSLFLINGTVLLGSLSLMAGINNGGGEYREYIWPIMLLFTLGLGYTLINFLKTIAKRKTEEIYISNWYIVSALIFISIVALVGYLPNWQNGLGETIVQGYYMHQAVGMWFMFFTLGIVYYFLPQHLNQPIYSYSLGILAFWTQILFYTLIGTHHFVFSAIPWWLQTVAIVASVGMVIPVIAGTTNFLMTFQGAWHKLKDSYTLPFFLVGIIFYFTGSLQGTAEAFRFTNLVWHFTDFTVAHSHLTMYGIITFLLWAGFYTVIPRITGREAPQITVGVHFWLALIGLMFYTIPLMYGGTLRGLAWMEGKPFIETVSMMMPYWLWRAIGGTLMWLSHLFFAYNFYKMVSNPVAEATPTDNLNTNL